MLGASGPHLQLRPLELERRCQKIVFNSELLVIQNDASHHFEALHRGQAADLCTLFIASNCHCIQILGMQKGI